MTEQAERVAIACPSCSPDAETVHEVLSTGGGLFTVRCTECDHVHKEAPPREETVEREVVVSQDGESLTTRVEVPRRETVAVGEEFIVDTAEALMAVRIMDLEVGPEQRVDQAEGGEVETFWTRAVDNVTVNATIHPVDGTHDATRSVNLPVPGDYEFTIGETAELGEETFEVESILIRDEAVGYPSEQLQRPGDSAVAKDIKRVYGRDAASTAWSAW